MRRHIFMQKYHGFYKSDYYTSEFICFYCGMPADTIDHVPAIEIVDAYGGPTAVKESGFELQKVKCCRDCNSMIGSYGYTVEDRLEYVANKLMKKFEKCNPAYDLWSEEELDELGPNLRSMIGEALRKEAILYERARHALEKLKIVKFSR